MKRARNSAIASGPTILAAGSFVAVPDAFQSAPPSLRNAAKFEIATAFSAKHRVQALFSTDRVLIDLGAVSARDINFAKLATDCDLLKKLVVSDPGKIRSCLEGLQSGSTSGVKKAAKIAKSIGLTEEQFSKQGGGFLFVVVLIGIAVGAGGCATLNSNKPFKASTTPKPRQPIRSGGGTGPGTPQ